MVIVKIRGGLGNQMFQYATARSLAARLRKKLALDLSSFEEPDNYRSYELDRFRIKGGMLTERRKRWEAKMQSPRYARLRRILRKLPGGWVHEPIVDDLHGLNERFTKITGNVRLEGFWQDERFFSDIRDDLLEEFTFKEAPDSRNREILSIIQSVNSVCVHVRRGDYVTHLSEEFGICSMDYYLRAIDHIRERVDKPSFFVFSDEPEWVASHFPRVEGLSIISHNTGNNNPEDMRLMMNCRHFIIANSSFSWWGAWLARFPKKIVIAPRVWFKAYRHGIHRAPDSWLRF
jgi:hypothetical protein